MIAEADQIMLDPRLLELFVTLAGELHFGRAADRLGIAQSTLSAQLRRLEDQVGASLVSRDRRAPVALTRVGALFLVEARGTLDHLKRAERIGHYLARGAAGPCALGFVFSAAMNGTLTELLAMIRADAPLVAVTPRMMDTPEQIQAIHDGRLDFGLGRPRPLYPAGLVSRIVHREKLQLTVALNHPLAAAATILAADLSGETILLPQFKERFGLVEQVEKLARLGGFTGPAIVSLDDYVSAASMAAAGYGVVLGPAALGSLPLDNLTTRPIVDFDATIDTVMVWHEDRAGLAPLLANRLAAMPPLRGHRAGRE